MIMILTSGVILSLLVEFLLLHWKVSTGLVAREVHGWRFVTTL